MTLRGGGGGGSGLSVIMTLTVGKTICESPLTLDMEAESAEKKLGHSGLHILMPCVLIYFHGKGSPSKIFNSENFEITV